MGLFTSFCKSCDAEIHWFLMAPENFHCRCGTYNSPEEINESWNRYIRNHYVRLVKDCMEKGSTFEECCKEICINPEFIRDVIEGREVIVEVARDQKNKALAASEASVGRESKTGS